MIAPACRAQVCINKKIMNPTRTCCLIGFFASLFRQGFSITKQKRCAGQYCTHIAKAHRYHAIRTKHSGDECSDRQPECHDGSKCHSELQCFPKLRCDVFHDTPLWFSAENTISLLKYAVEVYVVENCLGNQSIIDYVLGGEP